MAQPAPQDFTVQDRQHRLRAAGFAALFAALLLAPLVAGEYGLHALIVSMTFLLPALGLNLILGYAGMLSFAQMAFFGVSATY